MRKRSRISEPAGLKADLPAQNKSRRCAIGTAASIAALGLIAAAVCAAVIYHNRAAAPAEISMDDPRRAEVEELIRRYFRTWSNQDLKGYGNCFLPNASVQYIDADGQITPLALPAFLASQDAVFQAGEHEVEVPESVEIRFESKLARAVVYWKLMTGSRDVFGYDHFTLMKRDGKWGIVHLVFYETRRSG